MIIYERVNIRHIYIFLLGLFLYTVILPNRIIAQATGKVKEDFLFGEYYIKQNKYHEALPFFLAIQEKDSANCNINYRIGECYYNILGHEIEAIPYLLRSIENINNKYKKAKYYDNQAPPVALFLLGDVYHKDNKLDAAKKYYTEYKSYLKKKDKKEKELADTRIQQIINAHQLQSNPISFIEINLGEKINTRFSDYNPVLSGDENMLFYTSFWESYDIIFFCEKVDGEWTDPVHINNEINSAGDCYTTALSFDGKELLLTKMGNYNYDIYSSKFIEGKWTAMVPLSINSKYQETSACFSADGNTLYFSSDRPGGKGGTDIYQAQRKADKWVNIKNLGDKINTSFNEEAPYISSDNNKLYFCSNGPESMGDMDIMYSERSGDTWAVPVNIGYPLNDTKNNLFFVSAKEGYHGYISKYSPYGYGRNDIYKIIFDDEPKPDLSAEYIVENTDIDEAELYEQEPLEEAIPYYTIQIMALLKPVNIEYFSNIDNIKVSKGNDELYRYTYKKFYGYSSALEMLGTLRELYPDAFIRRITSISNY